MGVRVGTVGLNGNGSIRYCEVLPKGRREGLTDSQVWSWFLEGVTGQQQRGVEAVY